MAKGISNEWAYPTLPKGRTEFKPRINQKNVTVFHCPRRRNIHNLNIKNYSEVKRAGGSIYQSQTRDKKRNTAKQGGGWGGIGWTMKQPPGTTLSRWENKKTPGRKSAIKKKSYYTSKKKTMTTTLHKSTINEFHEFHVYKARNSKTHESWLSTPIRHLTVTGVRVTLRIIPYVISRTRSGSCPTGVKKIQGGRQHRRG